jgi:SAM-dependent methyltransferase
MNEQQARALIDYYFANQPASWITYVGLVVSGVALVISFGAVVAIDRQTKSSKSATDAQTRSLVEQHIRVEWTGILDACMQHPEFIDTDFTFGFSPRSPVLNRVYQAFCYKCWSLVELIVAEKLHLNNPYRSMVYWAAAYHRDWLQANPYMFSSPQFWEVHDMVRNTPLTLFREMFIPEKDSKPAKPNSDRYTDAVDWDKVNMEYSRYILGPFAPEMTEPDPKNGGKIRNLLITKLQSRGADLRGLRVVDFGCGPGNLMPHLRGLIDEVHGVDISETALELAAQSAKESGIKLIKHRENMITFRDSDRFDIIISVNSVLPAKREDVRRIFTAIRDNLRPTGKFYAVLPAFDACFALYEYWRSSYEAFSNDKDYVDRCAEAFRIATKLDEKTMSYADDGVHPQSFHTEESIREDFGAVGLRIVGTPQKVKYPWEYARRLDYGYFPNKPEIWDWFVEAER